MNDDEIMVRVRHDSAQFGEIFDRYFTIIHGYLSRRLDRTRADDLTGEVFRIAYDGRARFDSSRGGVRPWLYGIANNVVRQHLRDGERADRAWSRLSSLAANDESDRLDEQIDAQLQAVRLHEALELLLPADREALMLFAVEQLAYAEIADVMASPVGTVRSRISRARTQLRVHLSGGGPAPARPEGATHHG